MKEIKVTTTAGDYLKRLREIKAFMKHYNKFKSRAFKEFLTEVDGLGEQRNVQAYCALLTYGKLPIFHENGDPVTYRKMRTLDRLIIENMIHPVIEMDTGDVSICHEFYDDKYPLMPLREYIAYLSDGLNRGKISYIEDVRIKVNIRKTISVYTAMDKSIRHPILHKEYVDLHLPNEGIDRYFAVDILKDIHTFKVDNGIERCPKWRSKT